jgi:FkbM family methyltransferase
MVKIRTGNFADNFIFWEFISGGFYLAPALQPKLILDCGANIGFFAIHAGLSFPRVRIVCYEPEARNFELLRENLSLNQIEAECRPCGVWSSKTSGFFHPNESFDGHISKVPSPYPVECEVPEIFEDTWLKLDVEGAEYEVLPALLANLPLPKCVSMEVHDYHKRGEILIQLLKNNGYRLRIMTDGSATPEFADIAATLET